MNEAEVRRVLLVRAFEDPLAAPWTQADRDAVGREASRAEGENAAPAQWIVRRATLATARLAQRLGAVDTALTATAVPAWAAPAVPLLAFVAGLFVDSLGDARRLNLFSLPLLGMFAWNLAVYALLLVQALPQHRGDRLPLLLRQLVGVLQRIVAHGLGALPEPLARFVADWGRESRALQLARAASWLHAGAAAFALGALVSMYARGSFFEFRAGWESTFFDAPALHRLMGVLFGPAAWLSDRTLPDPDAFAALRWSAGEGENAARWIHLYAVTIGLVIVLPRLLLAALAEQRARRIANNFPIALGDAYFRRLLPRPAGAALAVQVLPYGHSPSEAALAKLPEAIEAVLDSAVTVQADAPVPLGGEDDFAALPAPRDGSPPVALAALFSLSATPEAETHGAFVGRLAAHLPHGARLLLLVDEAAFRERFTGPDGEQRRQQRRAAWRHFGAEVGHTPLFIDLGREVPAP
jgi:hypothetical protein